MLYNAAKVKFQQGGQAYSYLVPDELVDSLKEGDLVVVPVGEKDYTIGKVVVFRRDVPITQYNKLKVILTIIPKGYRREVKIDGK